MTASKAAGAGGLLKRRVWRTLRFRFALWVGGLLAVALVAFSAVVYVSQFRGLLALVDDSLRLTAAQTVTAVSSENGRLGLSGGIPADFAEAALERGLTIRILDPAGNTLQSLGSQRDAPLDREALETALHRSPVFATSFTIRQHEPVRIYSAPIVAGGQVIGVVQVAQTLTTTQEALENLLKVLVVSLPFLVALAGLGGYVLAARALAPIDQMTRTARRISAENLSARLNLPASDDEVGRLASTFDMMLARLDDSFRRERQFVSDASHELRTPLATLQTILGVMQEEKRSPDDYEQALADIGEQARRLRGLVESLLQLARSGADLSAAHQEVDLSELLTDVVESLRPLAESKGLDLTCTVAERLVIVGDADSLIDLFVNLVDNAIKFTERGRVAVAAARGQRGEVVVTVEDTGIGIAEEHLPHVFDRFYRADAARTRPGSGLGLAIAAAIVRMHGGTIEARSVLGQGTAFGVRLPIGRSASPGRSAEERGRGGAVNE